MKSHNIASIKAKYLQKEALALLPKDKQNISSKKKILNISQWMVDDIQINVIETDSVSTTMLLSQKWPFQLFDKQKHIIYAFMAGNDTISKQNIQKQRIGSKNLLNLSILFSVMEQQQPYIQMMAANALLQAIKIELNKSQCSKPLHIRWKHDILIQSMKVGQISINQATVEHHFYTQLNIQVNVKNIPKNFGAYDFQPTYLQKFVNQEIVMLQLANNIIFKLVENLNRQKSLDLIKDQIKQKYESQLIYLKEKVIIYDKKYEHIHHTGKFLGVTDQGYAILEGQQKPFRDGIMKFDCQSHDYLHLYRGDY